MVRQIWDYTDTSGRKNKFTWFFDEKQDLTKKVRVFSTADLTSKVDQRVDFVMTTPEKFTEVVNKLYPYFWDLFLNGCADEDDGDVLRFDVTEKDRVEFPELTDVDAVTLTECDQGFVQRLRGIVAEDPWVAGFVWAFPIQSMTQHLEGMKDD